MRVVVMLAVCLLTVSCGPMVPVSSGPCSVARRPIAAEDMPREREKALARFRETLASCSEELLALERRFKENVPEGRHKEVDVARMLEMLKTDPSAKEVGRAVDQLDLLGRFWPDGLGYMRHYHSEAAVACLAASLWILAASPNNSEYGAWKLLDAHGTPALLKQHLTELVDAAEFHRYYAPYGGADAWPIGPVVVLRVIARSDSAQAVAFIREERRIRDAINVATLRRQRELFEKEYPQPSAARDETWRVLLDCLKMGHLFEDVPEILQARLWDGQLREKYVRAFATEKKDAARKAQLAKALGEIGGEECARALAAELRSPLVVDYDPSTKETFGWEPDFCGRIRSVRVDIMLALGRIYPEVRLFNEDAYERGTRLHDGQRLNESLWTKEQLDGIYSRAEDWVQARFGTKWTTARPEYLFVEPAEAVPLSHD